MTARTCEETYGYDERRQEYLRCGAPAVRLIKHRGRREGPYWMCEHHAVHNIDNRNADDITPQHQQEPRP